MDQNNNYSNIDNVLKEQRQQLSLHHFRIQGSTIKERDNLECSESDNDLDDSTRDPDWAPQKQDEEHENNDNAQQDENEIVKRNYKRYTQELRVNRENGTHNIAAKQKRAKRGRAEKDQWEKNRNKRLRMDGEMYYGLKKGPDGKYSYSVEKEKRTVGERNCSKRCKKCLLFNENERLAIFHSFWNNMNWDQKKVFVISMVDKTEAKQKKAENSRRKYSFKYFLKKNGHRVLVCKKMFLSTLAIGERTLYDWLMKSGNGIPEKPNQRSSNHRNPDGNASAKEFLELLPKMPSHYCRASTSKIYLEPTFTSFSELYREYNNFCSNRGKNIISIKVFRRIFEDEHLSLFQPKKDQCDICCAFEMSNVSEEEYRNHVDRKEKARAEKASDKIRAQTSNDIKVVTLDLQAVLLCPLLKASALYYKTKLGCHNFTVHEMDSTHVTCYFWTESEGELTANSFASCLSDFIDKLEGVKELVIYSDGCTYQNRNLTVSNTLLRQAFEKKITIIQKYLEKGHTQMECDSIHSTIERKLRNKPIYCPQNYIDLIKDARPHQPYDVKYLSHEFFGKYSELKYYSSIRPGNRVGDPVVTNIRVLKYTEDGSIQYKLDFSDQYQDLARRSKVGLPSVDDTIERLYLSQVPIKKAKYQHLQELKAVIPRDFHPFYDSLPHN
ncbi:Hypothetical predicted protein [Mytilus galloprovincialis]|uniref:Uncharacterized protein n=1 Tax=Mytilus galloprovincialis TaxID=29158 RepID=A0A8B6C8H5_MYTGA|nr:Hypothetical predicted protein [Mytilus galloprovincialis]